jgi:hypothetical protein
VNQIIELGLAGEVNKKYMEQLLFGIEKGIPMEIEGQKSTKKFDIHIKIDYIDRFIENKGIIDNLLFSICFLRKFELKGRLIDIGHLINEVYIEVGNSIKDLLVAQRQLDIVSLLYDLENKVPTWSKGFLGF